MNLLGKVKTGDILLTLNENAQSYKCKSKVKLDVERENRVGLEIIEKHPSSHVLEGRVLFCQIDKFTSDNYKILSKGNIRKIT